MKDTLYTVIILITILTISELVNGEYSLTILHTNDLHGRIEQTDKYSGQCKDAAKGCYGGVARRKTAIDNIKSEGGNVIVLDAGDEFQGTLWFSYYQGNATAKFMKEINYDAFSLGNHEFDRGNAFLANFLNKLTGIDIVSANIDASEDEDLQQLIKKSKVMTVGGVKIGIIGYTTDTTPSISQPDDSIKFNNVLDAVRVEAARLKEDEGVAIIIALGHAGIEIDREIAESVPLVDIVVGGHTNTFLYNGANSPTGGPEEVYGPYPIVVRPAYDTSRTVLIVQDYAYGKYLGCLKVVFDDHGEVLRVLEGSNPILLDKSIAEDPNVLSEVNDMAQAIRAFSDEIIGLTNVILDGRRGICRNKECNLANLVVDAMVTLNALSGEATTNSWGRISIGLTNGGNVRSSIDKGNVTIGDVVLAQPFANNVNVLELSGKYIRSALEHGVAKLTPNLGADADGEFLQVSGLQVVYNICNPPLSRVVSVSARCLECDIPTYAPLEDDIVYKIITNEYISNGGDGYTMIRDNKMNELETERADYEYVVDYIRKMSPVIVGEDGRIMFTNGTGELVSKAPKCTAIPNNNSSKR